MRVSTALVVGAVALGLGACSVEVTGFALTEDKEATAQIGTEEAVLGPDGRCAADVSLDPSALRARPQAVEPGISECDLVRLKGEPTDVLIGESGKGQREAQVLYQEPSGKTVYLFADNKLTQIVN